MFLLRLSVYNDVIKIALYSYTVLQNLVNYLVIHFRCKRNSKHQSLIQEISFMCLIRSYFSSIYVQINMVIGLLDIQFGEIWLWLRSIKMSTIVGFTYLSRMTASFATSCQYKVVCPHSFSAPLQFDSCNLSILQLFSIMSYDFSSCNFCSTLFRR